MLDSLTSKGFGSMFERTGPQKSLPAWADAARPFKRFTMNKQRWIMTGCTAAFGLAAVVASIAFAEPGKDPNHMPPAAGGGMPEMKLPPGWTTEDMQACMIAGTPGKMHQELAKRNGNWVGKTKMWMAPGTDAMTGQCTAKIASYLDGRFSKIDVSGDMPGMGPFSGMGLNGYDNVTKKFVSTWVDNMSTGIMNGTGELSDDGKTLTWNFTMTCPIQKKAVSVRQVERLVDDDTMTLEMFGPDPKTGKEFKSMMIEYKRN